MNTKQFILLLLVFTLIIYLTKKTYKENFSNNFLNHIYVINLDKSKDRMENIKRIARESNLNIERFPAIYGKNLNYDF